jgi:diguanylate cyclase (GGDEF)-like protein
MELLLWRWSTAVQVVSALMVAVFFVAFAASVRSGEVRWWTRAWLANLAALGVTLFFWYFQPDRFSPLIRMMYMAAKTFFAVFMIEGAWAVGHQEPMLTGRQRTISVAVFAIAGGLSFVSLASLGIGQHSVMALLLAVAGAVALQSRRPATKWLAGALFVRSLLAVAETIAYTRPADPTASVFLSASSSFDSGAEWFVALACVLVASARVQSELQATNEDLLAAQAELRELADRDPLTGLANRRSLPAVFRAVYETGASILFFDLVRFKEVNDAHGHTGGDEYLKQFANALRATFRPDDVVARYAGDEFLVVARGLSTAAANEHLADLRNRLAGRIEFSVGMSVLAPEGSPEEAIRRADEAMYEDKSKTA